MGHPIALNLQKAGHDVLCFDSGKPDGIGSEGQGLALAASLAELAGCDTVFLCLPNGAIVEDVLFGTDGFATRLTKGSTIIDLSTIDHAVAVSIHERLKAMALNFLDAPISGMEARAIEGTLTVMAGGSEPVFERVQALFSAFATVVLFMGGPGAGQLTKLINQLLLDINAAAIAEVLPMSVKLGLDPEKIEQVINSGTGRSFASSFFAPRALDREFVEGYPLQAAYKDLVSAASLTAKEGIPMPVLAAATATYQQALLKGLGELDKGAMIQVYEDLLNVRFERQRG